MHLQFIFYMTNCHYFGCLLWFEFLINTLNVAKINNYNERK